MRINNVELKKILNMHVLKYFTQLFLGITLFFAPLKIYAQTSTQKGGFTETTLSIPEVGTINSTSLTVSCSYYGQWNHEVNDTWYRTYNQRYPVNYEMRALGVVWSTSKNNLRVSALGFSVPGLPDAIDNPMPNTKFIVNPAELTSQSFNIGDGGLCNGKVPTELLKPGTVYYICAFTVGRINGWGRVFSTYITEYGTILPFKTPDDSLINNNVLKNPANSFVCSNTSPSIITGYPAFNSTNTNFTYSWEQRMDNQVWGPVVGVNTSTYIPSPPNWATLQIPTRIWYRRKVTCPGLPDSYSNPVNYMYVPTPFDCNPVYDADGNPYLTVTIGTQKWLYENLNTTRFNDSTTIPYITTKADWSATTGPAYNQNAAAREGVNANLYNWYVANGTKNACPIGWHVSTTADWSTLVATVGGATSAGLKLKQSGTVNWAAPNTGATDTYHFNATPDGNITSGGGFQKLGQEAAWWEKGSATDIKNRNILSGNSTLYNNNNSGTPANKNQGFSIRCVKD